MTLRAYWDADWPGGPEAPPTLLAPSDRAAHAAFRAHAAAAVRVAARSRDGAVDVVGRGLLGTLGRELVGSRLWRGDTPPTTCLVLGSRQADLDAAIGRLAPFGLVVLAAPGEDGEAVIDLYDAHRRGLTLIGIPPPLPAGTPPPGSVDADAVPSPATETGELPAGALWYVRSAGIT